MAVKTHAVFIVIRIWYNAIAISCIQRKIVGRCFCATGNGNEIIEGFAMLKELVFRLSAE